VRGESLVVMTPSLERAWPVALMSPRMSAIARSVVLIDTPITSANSLLAMQALLNGLRIPTSIAGSRSQLEASPVIPGSGDWDFITTPTGGVVVRSRPNEVLS
jgi:hypothetical protein